MSGDAGMARVTERKTAPGTALITGASSGIGRELAALLARDGYHLVLVARDEARLAGTAERLRESASVPVTVLPCDLASPTAAEWLMREIEERGITVDVLVNNAGFNVYGPFTRTESAAELAMLRVHVVTLTHLTKLLLPGMLARRSGRILNVASTGSFAPGPTDAVYCASKAYVLSFSEALAEELRGSGVTVTALCPGPTDTEFAARAGMTDSLLFRGPRATPAAVARAGYRAMLRGRAVVIPGAVNWLMVLSLRFTPRALAARLSRLLLGGAAPASTSASAPAPGRFPSPPDRLRPAA
ncbi:MAG TPA: SDR family oxidoreductase [Chloroflexota bacterium]|nr:SDR family oxidoreductase [Chloroflexota bacterium]